MIHRKIEVSIEASYYEIGNDQDPERLWLVCHGYGQLASRFIKKFKELDMNRSLVVAPEGLSHFYLEGLSGNVGASWMTKHDREQEIENQFSFLETLMLSKVRTLHPKRLTLLGFSQGGATICRWAAKTELVFDDLYLWATIFPPDMDSGFMDKTLQGKNVKIFYGTEDPFIKDEHIERAEKYLGEVPDLEIISYKGDHRVYPGILAEHSS